MAKTPDKPAHLHVSPLLGLAAGIGIAVIAGGLFYALRSKPSKKRRKRKAKP